MDLKSQLIQDMKEAMKAKQADRLGTIRQLRGAIKNKEIDSRQDLDDQGVLAVINTLAKQRREAAQLYYDNDRPELAAKEEAELAVLEHYLPAQLSDEQIATLVDEVIATVGATSQKDLGQVMPRVMAQVAGAADGKRVNQIVRARLT